MKREDSEGGDGATLGVAPDAWGRHEATGAGRREHIGVLGLGRMGSVMAEALAGRFDLCAWDSVPAARERVTGHDGITLAPPAEWLHACSVVVSALPTPEATRAAFVDDAAAFEALGSQHLLIDTSTSDPDSVRALAEALRPRGAHVVDAPVLGRPDTCGQWTVPVGGAAEDVARARDVLAPLASRVVPVGDLGSAHALKLLNNLMFAAINSVTAEVLGSAQRVGVDPQRFVEVVEGSAAATVSPLFRALAPRMLAPEGDPVFTVELLAKDVRLARSMLERRGAEPRLAPILQSITERALERGLGPADSSALVELYRADAA